MKTFWSVVLSCLVLSACAPEPEPLDPADFEKLCDQCCPETKMEDLDFFGVYYSSCVQYITDLKALYKGCRDTTTVPDVATCVWILWEQGMTNGSPTSGCTLRVLEIAEVMSLPVGDRCLKVVPAGNLMLCEYGVRL